jgi:recombinational DNA repair ATPase RecF
MVDQTENYIINSNRESGYGRYDIMLVPHDRKKDAIVMEFKVHEADEEESLEDTVQSALKQIREKNYDAGLTAAGIQKEKIRHYGFAFEGKKVLIGK